MVGSLHAAVGKAVTAWQETHQGSLENINMEQHMTWQFSLLVIIGMWIFKRKCHFYVHYSTIYNNKEKT